MQQKRRNTTGRAPMRLGISLRVEYEYNGKSGVGYTQDMSADDMFVNTSAILSAGTDAEFHMPRDDRPISIRGKVMSRSDSRFDSGMGIPFARGQTAVREILTALVLDTLERRALDRLKGNPNNTTLLPKLADVYTERGNLEKRTGVLSPGGCSEARRSRGIPHAEDAESRNGTRLNGEPLEGNETVPVRATDVVMFGKVPLRMLDAHGLFELLSGVSGRAAPGSRLATRKWWFWGTAAGVVAVSVGAVLIATSANAVSASSSDYPTPATTVGLIDRR